MNTGDSHPTVELALSELRRSVDVGLAKIEGQLALLLQRTEAMEKRADQQAREIKALEARIDALERDSVKQADLKDSRDRTIRILTLIFMVVGILIGAGTALITTYIR